MPLPARLAEDAPAMRDVWRDATRTCETCGKVFGRGDKPGIIYGQFLKLRFCSPACSHVAAAGDPVQIFWSKVEKTGDCWLWRGRLGPTGYGIHWSGAATKKHVRAHRYSYELHHGPLPADALVLHACDVRNCVNPQHLRTGTQQENMRDRDMRGRTHVSFGAAHPSAKLTSEAVQAIRDSAGTERELAARYGVSASAIGAIRRGRTWGRT